MSVINWIVNRIPTSFRNRIPTSLRTHINRVLYSGILYSRIQVAKRHLSGEGIEIGAMQNPLTPHRNMKVKYVDNTSLEDNQSRFPELRGLKLVRPDYIEDGFSLTSFDKQSEDFVIANHVLEHSPNPLLTLMNWARVLRPGGSMLVTVPIAEACFDRGRQETTLEHFRDDYFADPQLLKQRNLEHYMEWVSISGPAILAKQGKQTKIESETQRRDHAKELSRIDGEIHFHTFSTASFQSLLELFCNEFDKRFRVAEIRTSSREVIGVITLYKN